MDKPQTTKIISRDPDRIRQIVHAWIREDAPDVVKMRLTHEVSEELVTRLVEAIL